MDCLGELLRTLRRKRGFSQEQLATRAQITSRALRYWEADHQQPREIELQQVLTALDASQPERAQVYTLLTDRRSIRLAGELAAPPNVPTALLGPLPGIGDLLRALRARRAWTQEQLAEEMRVSRSTVMRWEATRTLPTEEDMQRLCHLLNASPAEQEALRTRRLLPSDWPPQLTLDACVAQYEMQMQMRGGNSSFVSLADLHLLALKRQLRFLLGQSSEALRLLAKVEVHHSWWLLMQGRTAESCAGNWRALNLVRGTLAPEQFWIMALNVLAAHAAGSASGPGNAITLLYPWLRLIPASFHLFLLCDMALYAGRAQRHAEALSFLEQAWRALPHRSNESTGASLYRHWYFHMTKARVLLSGGRPVEALEWLPTMELSGDGRIVSLLVWAEAGLAAGEKEMAARYIGEAQGLLVKMPLPQRQSKLEELACRI